LKRALPIFLIIILGLSSCFKKEDPIVLPSGNSEIATLALGANYEKEVFFDLNTNTYQERRWADWDLRFDASKDGYGVFINTGKDMVVRKIDIFALIEPKAVDTNYFKTYTALVDAPEGKANLSAMGDWRSYKKTTQTNVFYGIYIIESRDKVGYKRFKRLQIIEPSGSSKDSFFYIIITELFDAAGDTVNSGEILEIPKNQKQNFTYYSFTNGIVDNAEPDKTTWDFSFTRYKHIFYNVLPNNQPFPYTVSGVLNNAFNVEIARDSAMIAFDDIDAASIPKYRFTTNRNAIGYDWKTHAQGPTGSYAITPKVTYIIRDTDGQYYKLRFLDYNNNLGTPGYPKFEFIRIK
jgi:hypothetical protein